MSKESVLNELLAKDHNFNSYKDFKSAVENYAPEKSVEKIGTYWTFKTISSTNYHYPVAIEIKKEALKKAIQHHRLYLDKLSEPIFYLSTKSALKYDNYLAKV